MLEEMGFSVTQEWVEPRSGYSVDLFVPWQRAAGIAGGMAVEVDGPYHYAVVPPRLGLAGAGGRRLPLGSTRLKCVNRLDPPPSTTPQHNTHFRPAFRGDPEGRREGGREGGRGAGV